MNTISHLHPKSHPAEICASNYLQIRKFCCIFAACFGYGRTSSATTAYPETGVRREQDEGKSELKAG